MKVLAFLCLVSAALTAKLPSSFTTCDRKAGDFNQCLAKAIENGIHQLNKPIKELGLPNMEPLEIESLTVQPGAGVAFEQKYKNLKVTGFVKATCSKAEMNFDKKQLSLSCKIPELHLDFNYEINGKILMLPIVGNGKGTLSLDDLQSDLTFNLQEYDKNGAKHYKVADYKLSLTPSALHCKLENLFNGDQKLSDEIHKMMNDNWQELYNDVKPNYEKAFAKIYANLFEQILSRVSISELFG